jgi:hypothetical protein
VYIVRSLSPRTSPSQARPGQTEEFNHGAKISDRICGTISWSNYPAILFTVSSDTNVIRESVLLNHAH